MLKESWDYILEASMREDVQLEWLIEHHEIEPTEISEGFALKAHRQITDFGKGIITDKEALYEYILDDLDYELQLRDAGLDGLTGLRLRRNFNLDYRNRVNTYADRRGDRRTRTEEPDLELRIQEDRRAVSHHPFSLVLFDLDYFKAFNDNISHLLGDQMLHLEGEIIREELGEYDIAYRYGGDELAIIAEGDEYYALDLAQRIKTRFEEALSKTTTTTVVGDEEVTISPTMSVGIASSSYFDRDLLMDEPMWLLGYSDEALRYSKDNGKDQISTYGFLVGSHVFDPSTPPTFASTLSD